MLYIWLTSGLCFAFAAIITVCIISAAMMSSQISHEEEEDRHDISLAMGVMSM